MQTSDTSRTAFLMLLSAMLIYGTIGIFRRYIPLSSGMLAFSRGIIGSAFLWLFLRIRGHRFNMKIPGRKLLLLILSGAMMGANWMLLFESYNHTTVAKATLCYYMEPMIVILAAPFLFREKLPLRKLLCVLAAFGGMVLVSGVLEGAQSGSNDLLGVALGLGSAVLYAAVVLMNKKITGVGAYEKTILQLLSAALIMVPYLLLTEDASALSLAPASALMLGIVCIVHTGIAYALYFGSIEHLRAQTVALVSYADPITAILLSALLLHEPMTPLGVMGAALVLGSTLLSEKIKA